MHSDTSLLLEREMGFEPTTLTLARLHSTTELLPQMGVLMRWELKFVKT